MVDMVWIYCALFLLPIASLDAFPKKTLVSLGVLEESAKEHISDDVGMRVKRDLSKRETSDEVPKKWPGGRVPYVISGMTGDEKNIILAAMGEIQKGVNSAGSQCIKFEARSPSDINFLNIVKDSSECSSEVGFRNRGEQKCKLLAACVEKGPVMHELVHVLGFFHEQTREDRDSYVVVNFRNTNSPNNFHKKSSTNQKAFNTQYDYTSIMHYGPYFMAIDRSRPVITPVSGKAVGVMIGQRHSLSKTDVLRIQRFYNCHEDTTHVVHQEANPIAACNFESHMCSLIQSIPSGWIIGRGVSALGPKAGHTNGADGYAILAESGNKDKTIKLSTASVRVKVACIDFFLYQKGPSSFLQVEALFPTGPIVIKSLKSSYHDRWQRVRFNLDLPSTYQIKILFAAKILSGDVAIDDLLITNGSCL